MLNFGQKIKKLRTDAGLSQAMLAEHIGVSVQSVSNWECNNTMPDISQIVPLASILCVSTDYLLGVGFDEKADHETLVRNVNTVWANYSVNTKENNADLLVANLYKEYLRKYPTDYEVKYKCALALYDYLLVGKVRGKFHIEADTYESIYTQCKSMLSSICNNTLVIELQINANQLMIRLMLYNQGVVTNRRKH